MSCLISAKSYIETIELLFFRNFTHGRIPEIDAPSEGHDDIGYFCPLTYGYIVDALTLIGSRVSSKLKIEQSLP